MSSAQLMSNNNTLYFLVFLCILVMVTGLTLLRKMATNDHNKMLKDKKYALENPEKIEKLKLVDHREVYCLVTVNKKNLIIAQGVDAVRVYDTLVSLNAKLG